ncbi:hypothetical protein DV515_00012217, partial [Chloebia gouldiae]
MKNSSSNILREATHGLLTRLGHTRRGYTCSSASREEEREVEADQAVPEKESSKTSLIHPPPTPPELHSSRGPAELPRVPRQGGLRTLCSRGLNRLKYHLLARLVAELGHAVPSSKLHCVYRTGDVLGFYCTPMKDSTKIGELAAAEMLPNLKIIWQQPVPVRHWYSMGTASCPLPSPCCQELTGS